MSAPSAAGLARPLATQVDARWYQITFLSTFLLLGIFFLGWQARPLHYAAAMGSCVAMQLLWEYISGRRQWGAWKSAFITSLSLSLLLYTNSPWTMALAGVLAISSKFLLRTRTKHFFNPANFGIIIAILLTADGWISPGQWGRDMVLLFLFCATGMLVLGKVGRVETSLVFLVSFFLFMYAFHVLYLGDSLRIVLHKMSNGALFLFSFFMITDPRATPNHRGARVVWTVMIAALSVYLLEWHYFQRAIFWSLFVLSPLTLLLDYLFRGATFRWVRSTETS